ncbi:T-cell immunoglobulin and mucin domain-containing protein 4-like [Eublepharis macularius]|uniref:T-cell immunoglobulin and mucin domain-containing protein 4-like n=1 Tax=Eublepharis macularius TaxID=481883 RepID=UPI00240EB625|nr:T-cell immunoglobulin and mucin domain-containing protein 4-like [Eublepharis macularius]
MFLSLCLASITVVLFEGFLASGDRNLVRGVVGQNITLPCNYSTDKHGITSTCWGRGICPTFKCSDTIALTDGQYVTYRQPSMYQLTGNIHQGDVALTIVNVTETARGMYCCRVEIKGWGNDQKTHVQVVIEKATMHFTEFIPLESTWSPSTESPPDNVSLYFPTLVKEQRKPKTWSGIYIGMGAIFLFIILGVILLLLKWYLPKNQKMIIFTRQAEFSDSATGGIQHIVESGVRVQENIYELNLGILSQTVVRGVVGQEITLPCTYSVQDGTTHMCWGRGACPNSKCSNEILRTNGMQVTSRTSSRYQLKGRVNRGDVSLTIANLKEGDKGTYCCRIEVRGWFNDLKKTLNLQVDRATTTTFQTTTTTKSHTIPITTTSVPLIITMSSPTTPLFLTTNPPSLAVPTVAPLSTKFPLMTTASVKEDTEFLTSDPPAVNINLSTTSLQRMYDYYFPTTESEIATSIAVVTSPPSTLLTHKNTENFDNCPTSGRIIITTNKETITTYLASITNISHIVAMPSTKAPLTTTLTTPTTSLATEAVAGIAHPQTILAHNHIYIPISCAVVVLVLLLMLLVLLVKRKKIRKYQLSKTKSLNELEEPELLLTGTEEENGLFAL